MKIFKFLDVLLLGRISGLALAVMLTACSDPQQEARETLESKGYEAEIDDLLLAAGSGDLESLELFRDAGFEIDATDGNGNTALIKAAAAGHIEAVEKILGFGADPRRRNDVGRDALIAASAKGFEEVSRMLLARGADPSIRDDEGWGALSIAAYNGHAEVVTLLGGQVSPEALDDALLVASFSGDPEVIRTLLGQGANINVRSPASQTPLMIAAESGKLEAARVLLQNQANPYAEDDDGRTAANLAEAGGFEDVHELILNPDAWGSTPESREVREEMADAQDALASGRAVEETLADTDDPATGDSGSEAPENSSGDPSTTIAEGAVEGSRQGGSEEATSATGDSDSESAPGGATGEVRHASVAIAGNEANTADGAEPRGRAGESTNPGASRRPAANASAGGTASPGAPVAASTPPRRPDPRRVREESRTKPVAALHGSMIRSRTPEKAPVETMILSGYHEEPLPIAVEEVRGDKAAIRRLDREDGESVEVEPGSRIPGTAFHVEEVTPKYVSSKEGKGRMTDVSRVRVKDERNGSTHLLVRGASGRSSDTYAILTAPGSQYRYAVKPGDVFRTAQPERGTREYQVLDIRGSGVVIKDLATDEVVTVARDGVIEAQ